MSRPKRRIRYDITSCEYTSVWWCPALRQWVELVAPRPKHPLTSVARALTKKQALRIARKALRIGVPSMLVVFRCPRRSRKWPKGFEQEEVVYADR